MENIAIKQEVEVTASKPMGIFKKILQIFISPSEVLNDVMEHPGLLMPLLYSSILMFLKQLITIPVQRINLQKLNDIYAQYGMPVQTEISTAQSVISAVLSPVFLILSWLFVSFVLWVLVKVFKGKSSFKQMLALYAHALIILVTGSLIAAPFNLILQTDIVIFSPVAFIPNPDITSFIYLFFSNLEFFTIWTMIIVAMGISLFNNFSKKKGFIIAFLYFFSAKLLTALYSYFSFKLLSNLSSFM